MADYTALCLGCGGISPRTYSWGEWESLPRREECSSKLMGPCGTCGGAEVIQTFVDVPLVFTDADIEIKTPGFNIAHGVRTPEQQEAVYASQMKDAAKAAKDTALLRRGRKRDDGEIRHIASIPREMYIAGIRQSGDRRYWDRGTDTKKTLKRHGLYFGD